MPGYERDYDLYDRLKKKIRENKLEGFTFNYSTRWGMTNQVRIVDTRDGYYFIFPDSSENIEMFESDNHLLGEAYKAVDAEVQKRAKSKLNSNGFQPTSSSNQSITSKANNGG